MVDPKPGMGAHAFCGSDCHPYTVVDVSHDGGVVVAQRDNVKTAETTDPWYAERPHLFIPNPRGSRVTFSLRTCGRYVRYGEPMRGGQELHLGERRYSWDPQF